MNIKIIIHRLKDLQIFLLNFGHYSQTQIRTQPKVFIEVYSFNLVIKV